MLCPCGRPSHGCGPKFSGSAIPSCASRWIIEDRIREKEARQTFDRDFIALARAVYHSNDERAAIKKRINTALGSRLVEEKSYQVY